MAGARGAGTGPDAHSRGSLMRDLTKYDRRVGDDSYSEGYSGGLVKASAMKGHTRSL